jgi:hypothetical protein
MASRVTPPSSEPKFYEYEEHGARVCEQELVPLFGGGKRDAMAMIYSTLSSRVSKEFGPTIRTSAYVRTGMHSCALSFVSSERIWINVFRSRMDEENEGRSAGGNVKRREG